jgi:hypothetical protein
MGNSIKLQPEENGPGNVTANSGAQKSKKLKQHSSRARLK